MWFLIISTLGLLVFVKAKYHWKYYKEETGTSISLDQYLEQTISEPFFDGLTGIIKFYGPFFRRELLDDGTHSKRYKLIVYLCIFLWWLVIGLTFYFWKTKVI